MATQKDLHRTAILTGAVQATRVKANDFIDVSVAGDNYSSGEQTFISPVDGYFSIAVSDAEGSNRQYMGVKVHADGVEQSATVNDSGLSYACHVPVKKGSSVKIASRGSSKVWWAHFIKVIGGGYKRYLPTLSCNRFGGALWLRLKTTSETLPRLVAGSRSRVGKLLISNLSVRPRGVGSELTSHLRTGILPYLLMQRPMLLPKSFLAMPASSCHRILQRSGLDALSLVGRGKSVNTPCTVKGSFKERRCSFIPRVACNNARMEVAA